MGLAKKVVFVAVPLLLTIGCGQSDKASNMEEKQTYSLCPKANDATKMLYAEVKQFAEQQRAEIIDRSSGAQKELSDIGSSVLDKTGDDTVLLTVEKVGEFRVSMTNLGLKEKLALSIRLFKEGEKRAAVNRLMDSLGRHWVIQKVDGGVTNDPPC